MNFDSHNLICDGSWEIFVHITDLNINECLRVKGDVRIGSIILMLVDKLAISRDWSDHAFWWPSRQTWLARTKNTLDQYGVQANTKLEFTPVHKFIALQMPDFKVNHAVLVDFSIPVYGVVANVCKDLGIRYPEELSLSRVYDRAYVKTGKKRSSSTEKSSKSAGRKTPNHSLSTLPFTTHTYSPVDDSKGAGSLNRSSNYASRTSCSEQKRNASYNANNNSLEITSSPYNNNNCSSLNVSNRLLSPINRDRLDVNTASRNISGFERSYDSGSDRPDSTCYYAGGLSAHHGPTSNQRTLENGFDAASSMSPNKHFSTPQHNNNNNSVNYNKPDESARYSNGSSIRIGHLDKRSSPYFSSDSGLNGNNSIHHHHTNGAEGIDSCNKNSSSIEDKHSSMLLYDSCKDLRETEYQLIRPKSYQEKARINDFWLNSSLSLQEQSVQENQLILLRYKYLSFYDLNPKLDAYRINLIFEQAKNAIIYETLEFSDEEAILFAALLLQSLNASNATTTSHSSPLKDIPELNGIDGDEGIYDNLFEQGTTTKEPTAAANAKAPPKKLLNGHVTGSEQQQQPFLQDIDAALNELQISLEYAAGETFMPPIQSQHLISNGSNKASNNSFCNNSSTKLNLNHHVTQLQPNQQQKLNGDDTSSSSSYSSLEIKDTIRIYKPKKFPFKSVKTYFTVFKEGRIFCYENDDSYPTKPPLLIIDLKNSELVADVDMHHNKFNIKIRLPSAKGFTEYYLKCDNENQYAKWMAACRLAISNSGVVNDPQTYKAEMSSILAFLNIQSSNLKDEAFTNGSTSLTDKKKSTSLSKDVIDSHKSDITSCSSNLKLKKISSTNAHHYLSSASLSPRNRFSTLLAESIYGGGGGGNALSSTLNHRYKSTTNLMLPRELQFALNNVPPLKLEDILPRRIIKKYKSSIINNKILDAYKSISSLTSLDAKMSYIRTWQLLPEFGFAFFTIRFQNSPKKEEILAITNSRIVKMDPTTGTQLKTWNFVDMQNWSINWEIKMVILEFDTAPRFSKQKNMDDIKSITDLNGVRSNLNFPSKSQAHANIEKLCFFCTSADCKIVHEFIGGYVFMSMRSKEDNARHLDESLFHKLTSGWN